MSLQLQLENEKSIQVKDDIRVNDLISELGIDDPSIIGAKVNQRAPGAASTHRIPRSSPLAATIITGSTQGCRTAGRDS